MTRYDYKHDVSIMAEIDDALAGQTADGWEPILMSEHYDTSMDNTYVSILYRRERANE